MKEVETLNRTIVYIRPPVSFWLVIISLATMATVAAYAYGFRNGVRDLAAKLDAQDVAVESFK